MSLKVVYQDGGPEPGGDVPTARITERIVAAKPASDRSSGIAAGSVGRINGQDQWAAMPRPVVPVIEQETPVPCMLQ